MKSPILMYGGKNRIADKLINHFPVGPKCYVEPFFGSGAVFYAIPRDLYSQRVINDRNKGIVTFFKVLRERPEELRRLLQLTPFAFDEQRACRNSAEDPEDELEVARRVWVRQHQNFGAVEQPSIGWRRGAVGIDITGSSADKADNLFAYAEYLRKVEINNDDGRNVVEYYGKEGAFVYSDPPYHPSTRREDKGYSMEMTEDDHIKLADAHKEAARQGALVAISGYDCEAYQELYKDWRRVQFEYHCILTAKTEAAERARTEVIWMSYGPEMELQHKRRESPKSKSAAESALLQAFRHQGKVK